MKSKIYAILILSFLIFVSLYYGEKIKNSVLKINDFVINFSYDIGGYIADSISEHLNQAEQIRLLKEQNHKLEEANALVSTFANQLNLLLEDKNSSQHFPQVSLVRAISYTRLDNYNRLWLSSTSFTGNKNKGLIYKGYTAGIAVLDDNRPMALLQQDEDCVFSVYIGKDKVPGVLQGLGNSVSIKFIPKTKNINLGDTVYTSGLDNIFFSGVPVGTVKEIIDDEVYQSALIEPFVEISLPSYMYMIDSL
ncbi:rod shape-determining protein MreC [uncultured Campylobacter sp.]|uniref:rod shape-determining protein MreC n=1 Tax=uncultured Campylobacter sp. TaxID=218934 RepID=UPI0026260399|nr:rod shape-determining protein MreC [uncultured Campylobacter sp.]